MAGREIIIGDVWDSTLDAARGRAGVIAPIALGAVFAPGAAVNAVALFGGPGAGLAYVLATLASAVLLIWGLLAIVAVVTDPATTRRDAVEQANRRIGAALANALLLGAIIVAALLPAAIALATAGINWGALQGPRPDVMRAVAGASLGRIRFAGAYGLFFSVFWLWLTSRSVLTYPVALNERRGLGAVGRSFALTRGAAAKLMGVLLVFLVLFRMIAFVVQGVATLPLRMLLGAGGEGLAIWGGTLAAGLVATAMMAMFAVFSGRLYVAASEGA